MFCEYQTKRFHKILGLIKSHKRVGLRELVMVIIIYYKKINKQKLILKIKNN